MRFVKYFSKLLSDLFGVFRACGLVVAARWGSQIAIHLPAILRRKDLQLADLAMGDGPYRVRVPKHGVSFWLKGPQVFGVIREICIRDVYLRQGWLQIRDADLVVDLGANVGSFTNLALAMGPNVRVIAVEPSQRLNTSFRESLALNPGHADRVKLVRAFVGSPGQLQDRLMTTNSDYKDADWIGVDRLIDENSISRVDFLKCDIEGGEFGLLDGGNRLLGMTRNLAVEIHAFAGDVNQALSRLQEMGFQLGPIQRDSDGSAIVLAKRF